SVTSTCVRKPKCPARSSPTRRGEFASWRSAQRSSRPTRASRSPQRAEDRHAEAPWDEWSGLPSPDNPVLIHPPGRCAVIAPTGASEVGDWPAPCLALLRIASQRGVAIPLGKTREKKCNVSPTVVSISPQRFEPPPGGLCSTDRGGRSRGPADTRA